MLVLVLQGMRVLLQSQWSPTTVALPVVETGVPVGGTGDEGASRR